MIKNENKETEPKSIKSIIFYICLSLALVTTVALFIYTVVVSPSVKTQLSSILQIALLAVFTIFFTFTAISTDKKGKTYAAIASICLTCFSGYQLLEKTNILNLPTQQVVEDFNGKIFTDAVSWASDNKITLEQIYEKSDIVEENHIISQDIKAGTLAKDITKLTITISEGPDYNKEVVIPSMLGWDADKVLAFIKENFLSNVEVNFIISDEKKDTVIEQVGSGNMKRNDKITLTFSIGTEEDITTFTIADLTNLSEFEATFYLKRHGISYEINHEYSKEIRKGYVIKNNKANEEVNPKTDKITLTISKGAEIKVPDLTAMTMEEIAVWISENKLKVKFTDRYDDNIKETHAISASVKKDDIIEEGTLIEVVISKGQLKMERFTSVTDFKEWADKYGITYTENYEFNDSIKSGEIISFSHKDGEVIKNGDSVTITISQGKALTVPNFIGKSKSSIASTCKDKGLTCTFVYGKYNDNVAKDIATGQSKKEGSTIGEGASISITLSRGPQAKVNVPSFLGQNQRHIQASCNNLGITCKFTTSSSFSNKDDAGLAISQSAQGSVLSGSTVNITLSRGKQRSCTIVIQENWFGQTGLQTKNTLINKLSSCTNIGVNFIYQIKAANEGSGIINQNSPIKAGSHTFYEGESYTIIINE